MTQRLLTTLCLGLGLALAGCTPPTSEWTEAQAPKKLHIDFVRMEHATAFAPGTADLAQGEDVELASFLEQSEVTGEDHLYLQAAVNDSLAAQRIAALTRQLAPRGIGATALPPSAKDVPADHMLLVLERYVVTPPDCPDWTKPEYGAGHSNTLPSNWGCADTTNLGLMVADPRDLVIGRTLGPAEGNAATAAILRYRECKTKQLAPVSASDIYAAVAQGGGDSNCDKITSQ
jgi:pilus assembly protein CpaD